MKNQIELLKLTLQTQTHEVETLNNNKQVEPVFYLTPTLSCKQLWCSRENLARQPHSRVWRCDERGTRRRGEEEEAERHTELVKAETIAGPSSNKS